MMEYPKIYGPYKRHTEGELRNQLIEGAWVRDEYGLLADNHWYWFEKIDGTNIRVKWDGHKVEINGRTDNAQLHGDLVKYLLTTFTEELFEQEFGSDSVMLFGEGCGPGIQKGGAMYGDTKHFILFDVLAGTRPSEREHVAQDGFWLRPNDIEDVANKLGIPSVPLVQTGSVYQAINTVAEGFHSNFDRDQIAEGLVGVPAGGLLDRSGRRIQMKVKSADFHKQAEAA
jgi:hypothetical protein